MFGYVTGAPAPTANLRKPSRGRRLLFLSLLGAIVAALLPLSATSRLALAAGNPVVANGGFEAGTAPWSQWSTVRRPLITTTRPYHGSFSASFGGLARARDAL